MRGWTKNIARVCAHLACADPYRHGLGSNRIEMLNLKRSMRGQWMCLQRERIREELRVEEWQLDVRTMGQGVLVEHRVIHIHVLPLGVSGISIVIGWYRGGLLDELGSCRHMDGQRRSIGPFNGHVHST
ncbi:hypothetical protein ARMGADRAFT_479553 [Armillaria gallica]|uniref:Uncharacterized protein n=1 Tax=Armillaria gallica TaxID=47427 RepID=A0A2H3CUP6_ARMGA|nr:hypothetical protein ARMGADRAFT_479553 [Armillaria gallica]